MMRYRMIQAQGRPELALLNDAGELRRMGEVWSRLAGGYAAAPERPTLDELLASRAPHAFADELEAAFEAGVVVDPAPAALVPLRGGDLLCIGRNYAEHAAELGNAIPGEPIVFMKPRASLIASGEPVHLPDGVKQVHYEGELALVIGKPLSGAITPEQARDAIFGVTLMNDVTDRAKQNLLKEGGKPWVLAKGRSSFAPFGPNLMRLKPEDAVEELELTTHVNGELRQQGTPSLWLFPLPVLIDFLARMIGLRPGDVIATGTPKGVGAVAAGDIVTVSSPSIGVLENRIV